MFYFLPFTRSFVETLSTAAFDSIKEFKALLSSSRSPFVTNNSHYDHDDDKLTVWPGRHGGPSLGAFLSHGWQHGVPFLQPWSRTPGGRRSLSRGGWVPCITTHLLIAVFFLIPSSLLLPSSFSTSCLFSWGQSWGWIWPAPPALVGPPWSAEKWSLSLRWQEW